jgi:hypothetical protein
MIAIRALYENGQVTLLDPVDSNGDGPLEGLLVLPRPEADPWDRIINDPTPRPALTREGDEVLAEHRAGRTGPMEEGCRRYLREEREQRRRRRQSRASG